jgi:hypothetical protein
VPAVMSGPVTIYASTTGTWQAWNQAYVTTADTSATGGTTWQNWNQAWSTVGTASSISLNYATGGWIQWNTDYTEAQSATPVTDEVLARRRQEQAEAVERVRQQQEESRRLVEEVSRRAEELLVALLSDEQVSTWREHSYFTVRGSRSGALYRIRRGISGNVDRMLPGQPGVPEVTFCAHPPGIPAEDVCLAQMFLLVTDEEAFLRVANVHQRHRPNRQVYTSSSMELREAEGLPAGHSQRVLRAVA